MHVFVCVCVSYFLVTKLDAIVAQPKASALLRYCWVVFVVASVQVRTVYVMYYTNLHIIVCDSAGFTWCACRLVDLVFGRLRRILASLSRTQNMAQCSPSPFRYSNVFAALARLLVRATIYRSNVNDSCLHLRTNESVSE